MHLIGSSNGKNMLHCPVDLIIMNIIEFFHESLGSSLPVRFDCNTIDKSTASTISSRRCPDLLCWLKDVLLFEGEERTSYNDFNAACEELTSKMTSITPIYF